MKIKSIAEKYTESVITDAVITVPAYFNDAQRSSTKLAGELAGLNVIRMINEPTAAALAYGLNLEGERIVMVYDLGGGTLDVSILTIADGIFEVKSTAGDTHLGGEDFDMSLRKYCLLKFAQDKIFTKILDSEKKLLLDYYKVNNLYEILSLNLAEISPISSPNIELIIKYHSVCHNLRLLSKINDACEEAKRIISYKLSSSIIVESFFEGEDMIISLTRDFFEKLCRNEFERCMKPVLLALSDAKLAPSDITDVVLVGGSSRIPHIHFKLKEIFGDKLRSDINPDEAVAYGAAIQANILSAESKLLLIDVNSMSVGIEIAGGVHKVMIPKNSPLPASHTEIFTTSMDLQPSVCIRVFEGEQPMTKDLNLLGTFTLDNLPIKPKGQMHLIVSFTIDTDGIMNISATEKENGINKKICINKK
jgi:molecular chaperone DnaK (HSP70)